MKKILIVDDDVQVSPIVRLCLADHFEVHTVSSVSEALAHLELTVTDLVLTDFEMPLLNGVDLVEAIEKRGLRLPVIMMSGRPYNELAERTRHLSLVRALLTKPFRPAELRETVGRALRLADADSPHARSRTLPTWTFPAPATPTEDPVAAAALETYWLRQSELTKPAQSLGRLEEVGAQLAALQRSATPSVRPATALLFASDHPVADLGVSAYPMAVTRAMVQNFAQGGAAASVLCRMHSLPLRVIDVGVAQGAIGGLASEGPTSYVRAQCADMPVGNLLEADAMPLSTFLSALDAGRKSIDALPPDTRAVVIGEMGIGNSTCAAAVMSALLGAEPEAMVGPGTGVTGAKLARKVDVVRAAVERTAAAGTDLHNGFDVMRALGGRDLAAMMGAMATAVQRRIAVIVDGYIATASAFALLRVDRRARAGLVFAHSSREPGHGRALTFLGVKPLVSLDLALGEGSGALVAWPIVEAACRLHAEMATFTSAHVPVRTT